MAGDFHDGQGRDSCLVSIGRKRAPGRMAGDKLIPLLDELHVLATDVPVDEYLIIKAGEFGHILNLVIELLLEQRMVKGMF